MKRTFLFAVGGLALGAWAIARLAGGRFSFADKVILITGGSRGLGLVIARRMAREGGRIALLARDQAELDRACDDLSKHGAKALAIRCDLLERTQIKEAVGRVLDHFGTIDVLINNAGIIEVGPLENMEREDFEKAMNLHLWAPFHLMWEIIPHMRRRGNGRIVNISSIGGKIAVPHLAPYSTSKFALVGLSDAMRNELARDGIQVTTVAPGMMRTGSHVNAKFKGEHAAEFAWFSASAGLPLISMSAERAVAKIVEACRRGQPALTLGMPARAAIIGNAIFPNLFGRAMKLVNRFLPGPVGLEGNELRSGWQSRSERAPDWLTHLADRATEHNNETRSDGSS